MFKMTRAHVLRTRGVCAANKLGPSARRGPRRTTAPSRRGATAVELALVLPVFLMLVFALIEMGRMVMLQQALTNAAREGCRTAVLATTTSGEQVEAAVRDYLRPVMSNASSADEVRVMVPAEVGTAATGTDLTVAVEVNFADETWLPINYLGLNPTIGAMQVGKRE